eukprot:9025893-Ditylum_brightwellii.AAC.1
MQCNAMQCDMLQHVAMCCDAIRCYKRRIKREKMEEGRGRKRERRRRRRGERENKKNKKREAAKA